MKKTVLLFFLLGILLSSCEPSSDELNKMKEDARKTSDSIKWAAEKYTKEDSSSVKK